jgi:hypothetical protein
MSRALHFILWLCAAAALVRGQSIAWDPPGGSIAVGQAVSLRLICRDCEPTSAPALPKVPDLQSYYQGPSSSLINDNGVVSQTFAYTFTVLWPKKEVLEFPAFDVPTNHGSIHVAAARFEPAEATVGNTGKPLSAAANAKLTAQPARVWAGQVVQLDYRVQAEASYRPDFAHQPPTWNADTLVAEEWSKPEAFESHAGGDTLTGLAYRTRVIAPRAGTYELQPVSQLVNLSVGLAMFGFFQSPQFQQYSVPSAPVRLQVKDLPPAPPGFTGAVGNFALTSKVVPVSAGVREPITWTLELSGTGNWPQINRLPSRTASRDFEVVHPQLQHTPAPGKIFDASLSEDVVLIPTKAGRYVLPAVHFVFFDPAAGEYRTISSPESSVEIAAAPGGLPVGPPVEVAAARPPAVSPALPAGLPRDPLNTGGRASLPLSAAEWLAAAVLVPGGILAVLWLALARKRAQWTDQQRPRREARLRLEGCVREIASQSHNGTAPVARSLLLDWLSDAARWRSVSAVVPVPEAFGDPAWTELAAQVDRALYGPAGLLPSDWPARAEQALAEAPPPRFRSIQLFLPRNLLPLLTLMLLASMGRAAGADPLVEYRAGHFAAAERAWRALSPLDPAGRYNISLALAQQDHWPEAAAHAAAAFVQDPSNPVIRAHFATACERAGVSPGPLTPFLAPSLGQRWAETFSPGGWQECAIAGAILLAAAAALALVAAYRGDRFRSGALQALRADGRPESLKGFRYFAAVDPFRSGALQALRADGKPESLKGFRYFAAVDRLRSGALQALRADSRPESLKGFRYGAAILAMVGVLCVGGGVAGYFAYGAARLPSAAWVVRAGTLRSIPTEADAAQSTVPLSAGSIALIDKTFLGWVRLRFSNGTSGWVRTREIVTLWR